MGEKITFDGELYFDTVQFDIASVDIDSYDIEDEDLLDLLYRAYPLLSAKKIREFTRYCKILQWGRKNPVDFAAYILGIELLDLQKYATINSWDKKFVLWLECRNAGKSTLIAIYVMLRSLLIPYHVTYILGNTGNQAKETFEKIEKIVQRRITSFGGVNDIFEAELQRPNTMSTGFKHDPSSFEFKLFNEAAVFTLNSDPTNIKGKRADLVVFDEAGWFSSELFVQAEAFVNQDENFVLGGDKDMSIEPRGFPKQLLYASSASDTSSEFYKKFRNISERMLIGDNNYFAVNYDADMLLGAKMDGEEYASIISPDVIAKAMSEDKEKALREYYNKFSADSFQGQIVSRRDIMNLTEVTPPILNNDTGNRLIVMAWDSARLNDNSVIVIAEFYEKIIVDPATKQEKNLGWHMRILNVVSLVDINTKQRTPKRFPEQVKEFKELLLAYNGSESGRLDYEQIKQVIFDAGAGGQIIGSVADYMLESWTDSHGKQHKGIIDKSHKAYASAVRSYPDALDIVTLVDPKGNRNAIFDAIERMIKLGVVSFPADPEGRDYLTHVDDEGKEIVTPLSPQELVACSQIELMKKEIITMCKFTSQGNVRYDFPVEKRNKMHDDRVFAFGLLCWYLASLRRGQVVRRKPEIDYSNFKMPFRQPVLRKR